MSSDWFHLLSGFFFFFFYLLCISSCLSLLSLQNIASSRAVSWKANYINQILGAQDRLELKKTNNLISIFHCIDSYTEKIKKKNPLFKQLLLYRVRLTAGQILTWCNQSAMRLAEEAEAEAYGVFPRALNLLQFFRSGNYLKHVPVLFIMPYW